MPERRGAGRDLGFGAACTELGVEAGRGSTAQERIAGRGGRDQSGVRQRADADHFRLRRDSGNDGRSLLCNVIGRRPTYTLLCVGSLAVSLLFYLGNSEFGWPLLISMFFVGGITASFYGWLPLYLPELFPTRVRATGQGFSFNFGRILAAIGALQSGNLMTLSQFGTTKVLSHAHACATMSLVYVIGMGLIWFAPRLAANRYRSDELATRRAEGVSPRVLRIRCLSK